VTKTYFTQYIKNRMGFFYIDKRTKQTQTKPKKSNQTHTTKPAKNTQTQLTKNTQPHQPTPPQKFPPPPPPNTQPTTKKNQNNESFSIYMPKKKGWPAFVIAGVNLGKGGTHNKDKQESNFLVSAL